jgi:putative SOS response-associated peptidase YedK
MCAQYLILRHQKNLELFEGLDTEWSERVLPYTPAPVLTAEGPKVMNYSLIPVWSKEPKPKFATHNARLETITEKATWKRPFLKHHCAVPMNAFIEPIYTGELAGNMVRFNSKDILWAAGIHDSWVNKETGEVIESFAIITSEPSQFVKDTGHDRQPLFLTEKNADKWLKLAGEPDTLVEFLNDNFIIPKVTTEVDRPLKKGWEKRIPKGSY